MTLGAAIIHSCPWESDEVLLVLILGFAAPGVAVTSVLPLLLFFNTIEHITSNHHVPGHTELCQPTSLNAFVSSSRIELRQPLAVLMPLDVNSIIALPVGQSIRASSLFILPTLVNTWLGFRITRALLDSLPVPISELTARLPHAILLFLFVSPTLGRSATGNTLLSITFIGTLHLSLRVLLKT